MNTVDLLIEAYKRGRAWNPDPEFANLHNLDESRILKMSGEEADAKLLVRSLQYSDIQYDDLVALFHKGRKPDYDAEIGPATVALVKVSRCAMPDFAPPPNASFHYDDPDLQAAVVSYQAYDGGSGSWPGPKTGGGCDPLHRDIHSVVTSMDTSAASTHQKSVMAEVLRYVEETEAEMGQSVRHVLDGSYEKPQHSVKFQYIAGGVIGFAYFPEPDTCNQTVNARIDNSFNANAFVLAELLTHEYKGHSDGLGHTRGGIMNPSIGSPTARASWKGDPHEKTKTRYFGGIAIPTTTPTPTGDTLIDELKMPSPVYVTNAGRITMSSPVLAMAKGQVIKQVNLINWPRV